MNNWYSGNRLSAQCSAVAGAFCLRPRHFRTSLAVVEGSRDYFLLDDRFMVSAGTFLLTTQTKIAINGTAGNNGTEIDTEEDLGFRDADPFAASMRAWRFATQAQGAGDVFQRRPEKHAGPGADDNGG